MVSTPESKTPSHVVLAVVFQIRDARLHTLLWQRARAPYARSWALAGGNLEPDESLEQSIRRHLAAKVDVRELSHLEQLETRSDPQRNPDRWELATSYLGLIPRDANPSLPADTNWHPADNLPALAYDHQPLILAGQERLRAKLSYTNLGFALAPPSFTISELRQLYRAALGHDVNPTNLRRVLLRRQVIEQTGQQRNPSREGGRPAALFHYTNNTLTITDQFAVLKPPPPSEPPTKGLAQRSDEP